MYCPNCGEKLRDKNQSICPNCGSEISTIYEAPQPRIERDQYVSTPSSQSIRESSSPPLVQQKVINAPSERSGVHSKRCLAFSITSLALTFPFWGYNLFMRLIEPYNNHSIGLQIIRTIVILITAVSGLIFGILAKINSSKAVNLEPENGLEKVGSVLAIIGIIINALLIATLFFASSYSI